MFDIPSDCQAAAAEIRRWTDALMAGRVDELEDILTEDFQFTVEPRFGGGRMDKTAFIDMDRKIKSCTIALQSITARRFGGMVTMLICARVREEFFGDLGDGMPSVEEMSSTMSDAVLAYGSGFRVCEDARWRCFSHHIFGFVEPVEGQSAVETLARPPQASSQSLSHQ